MKDAFEDIHKLLKQNKKKEVVDIIFDSNTNSILSPYDKDLNHAWYILGNIFTDIKDYETAISAFKKSLNDWKDDDQALSALAYCYMEINKPEIAQKNLEKAIKLKPKEEYYYNLGNSFFDQKKYHEAIKLYKKVSKEDEELYELAKKNIKHSQEKIAKNKRNRKP